MLFFTIIMDIIELSAFLMQIGLDLRRTRGLLCGIGCLLEGI